MKLEWQLGSHLERGRVGSTSPFNSMAQAKGLPLSSPNQGFQHLCGIMQPPVSPTQRGRKRSKRETAQLGGRDAHLGFEPRCGPSRASLPPSVKQAEWSRPGRISQTGFLPVWRAGEEKEDKPTWNPPLRTKEPRRLEGISHKMMEPGLERKAGKMAETTDVFWLGRRHHPRGVPEAG